MSSDSLLVELGTEELPPKALKSLGQAFRDGIVAGLDQRALSYGQVNWFATPRRLAVHIQDVQQQAPEKTIESLGPPVDRARDEAGNWTPAASGFARKQGVEPDQLEILDTPKGQRLGLRSTAPGASIRADLNRIFHRSGIFVGVLQHNGALTEKPVASTGVPRGHTENFAVIAFYTAHGHDPVHGSDKLLTAGTPAHSTRYWKQFNAVQAFCARPLTYN